MLGDVITITTLFIDFINEPPSSRQYSNFKNRIVLISFKNTNVPKIKLHNSVFSHLLRVQNIICNQQIFRTHMHDRLINGSIYVSIITRLAYKVLV